MALPLLDAEGRVFSLHHPAGKLPAWMFRDHLSCIDVAVLDGVWTLDANGASMPTDIPEDYDRPTLFVLKIEFREAGDAVSLWINPPLGAEDPGPPAAMAAPKKDVCFRCFRRHPGKIPDAEEWDEIRVGETYDDVTPRVAAGAEGEGPWRR